MDFDSALDYLQGLRRFGIKLGNQRFEALLARLENPHRGYAIAHVAGTKGKGSVTVMTAGILQSHGFRTGSYFSPYVYDVTERVQIDGRQIPRQIFARLVGEIRPHIEELARTDLGQTTEFELKTALGFRYFKEQSVDAAAIEVGIGGRLDATNVVEPVVTVITNIGYDHTHILGDTLAQIAYEKAGIIKPGVPCVTAVEDAEALDVIKATAAERGAPLIEIREAANGPGGSFEWDTKGRLTIRSLGMVLRDVELGLKGRFQGANAASALMAVQQMASRQGFVLTEEAVREGLRKAYLPGRMEVVNRRPLVIMDGAHNGLAARVLAEEIKRLSFRRLMLVIGMIGGHSPDDVLRELAPLAHAVFVTEPRWRRRQPAEELAVVARKYCTRVQVLVPPVQAARAALRQAAADDVVLVTGSFFVVGDVPPAELLENS